HVKQMPGSHAILQPPANQRNGAAEPPREILWAAASIAAYFSKGRHSANVPVDYTLRKHVRKPKGAKPGMVIYDHHRTLYVDPPDQAPQDTDAAESDPTS